MDMIKAETDVDVQSEDDPIGLPAEEVHIPSPFCVKHEEFKVSLVFRYLLLGCVCVHAYLQRWRIPKLKKHIFFQL
jgi:hypothetical protein